MRANKVVWAVVLGLSGLLGTQQASAVEITPVKPVEAQIKDKFTTDELIRIFKNEGYSAIEKVSEKMLVIKINGKRYLLLNYDDGDLQAHYGFGGVKISCKSINIWNKNKRLSRAYLDDDNDPVIEADLLSDGGIRKENVIEFFKVFVTSVDAFRTFLLKHDES